MYNAQDMEIKDFKIGKAVISNGTAQVKVSFTNFDRKEEIRFDLGLSKTGWKVSNLILCISCVSWNSWISF